MIAMGLFLGLAFVATQFDLPVLIPVREAPVSQPVTTPPGGPTLPGKGLLGSRENIQPVGDDPPENLIDGATAIALERSVRVQRGSAGFSVVEGDTFNYGGARIRIADIDSPETHPPRCAEEAALGARATQRLSELLSAGPFELHANGRDEDSYGRKLRIVTRSGRSLGDTLVAEGLARPYGNGRRPWCA